MDWQQGYIAVDWGTTNRRAYRMERGQSVAQFADDLGLLSIRPGGFAEAVQDVRDRLGDLPMLLAGMVGSNRGWHEAPYAECPAGPAELAASLLWVDSRTGIVPGVCQRGEHGPDVMRGEEIQLVGGIAAGLIPDQAIVCHPGTHAKWVEVQDGRIARFRTMMTGEVFALLRSHSILAAALGDAVEPGADFDAGVSQALAGEPLLSGLFRIRARGLLDVTTFNAAAHASGLLIGNEVVGALRKFGGEPVIVIGRGDLCELYARALNLAGCTSRCINGNAAFLAGANCLTERL